MRARAHAAPHGKTNGAFFSSLGRMFGRQTLSRAGDGVVSVWGLPGVARGNQPVFARPYAVATDGYARQASLRYRAAKLGAGYRTRTCDPLITNQVLYQLS